MDRNRKFGDLLNRILRGMDQLKHRIPDEDSLESYKKIDTFSTFSDDGSGTAMLLAFR